MFNLHLTSLGGLKIKPVYWNDVQKNIWLQTNFRHEEHAGNFFQESLNAIIFFDKNHNQKHYGLLCLCI